MVPEKEKTLFFWILANLQDLQPSVFFLLIHIYVAFPFFLDLVYKTSEFQGQCAIAGAIEMDLYMGQQISIQPSNQICKF